jgi:hypothetical protein
MNVSETVHGEVHDFKLLEEWEEIPHGVHAIGDSGYEGISNIHEYSEIPERNSRTASLLRKKRRKIAKYQRFE